MSKNVTRITKMDVPTAKTPRIISDGPSVENTIHVASYRAQSPSRYSHADGDKFIYYAGSVNCAVELPADQSTIVHHDLNGLLREPVTVYVLDTSLVLWLSNSGFGVSLPYPSITLHALKKTDAGPVLYLQVVSCELFRSTDDSREYAHTAEIVIREGVDGGSAQTPLVALNSSILEMYEALSVCSALHPDSDSDSDSEGHSGNFALAHEWFTSESDAQPQIEIPASWLNSGDADDLGMALEDDEGDSEGEASMHVELGQAPIAGQVRRREPSEPDHVCKYQRRQ